MSKDSDMADYSRSISPFRRNLSEIPCFRQSFITGILGGIGVGTLYFMNTSKGKMSSHVSVGSFITITLGTWCYCRYHWSMERIRQRQMKAALQTKIFYEGTPKEQEILAQAKDA